MPYPQRRSTGVIEFCGGNHDDGFARPFWAAGAYPCGGGLQGGAAGARAVLGAREIGGRRPGGAATGGGGSLVTRRIGRWQFWWSA
jgi:hypothetical protein